MPVSIHCATKTLVVAPNAPFDLRLEIRDDDGRPVAGCPVRVVLSRAGSASLVRKPPPADADGKVYVSLRAARSPARAVIKVSAEGARAWKGSLFVTAVRTHAVAGLALAPAEERLLQMLYWDRDRVEVLRQFGGGFSGSRVFLVQAVKGATKYLPEVVKVGPRDRIRHERANYRKWLESRLSKATRIRAYRGDGELGAVVYESAGAKSALAEVVTLGQYFERPQNGHEHVATALYALQGQNGMRQVYRNYRVQPKLYEDLFGTVPVETLVLDLRDGQPPFGVYPRGQLRPDVPGAACLGPGDAEGLRFPHLNDGDTVVLEQHRVARVRRDHLILEGPRSRPYRVRVLCGQVPRTACSAGEKVDVVAAFVTDHERRPSLAVPHCLKEQGAEITDDRVRLAGETYPNPVRLLGPLLSQPCDVAWGTIHGDLHWDNVLLEGPSNWWLIDYDRTQEGPILSDFIRLELFLRYTVLSGIPRLGPAEVLAFEQDLADNPLGRLPARAWDEPLLRKGAEAIRTIRRMARPYLVDDLFDYWRLLFLSSVAMTKHYPLPQQWEAAGADRAKLGTKAHEVFACLAPALVVGRLLEWEELRSRRPAISFDFVPMGSTLTARPGVVALDVGGGCGPGVIDHHVGGGPPDCATSLVWKLPELVTDHLAGTPPDRVTWTVHERPDFDCVASTYLGWHRFALGFFPPGAGALAEYALGIDRGGDRLDRAPFPERTPYGLFVLYVNRAESFPGRPADLYGQMMEDGFRVMDFLCGLEACGVHAFADDLLPHEHDFLTDDFLTATRSDRERFERQDLSDDPKDRLTLTLRVDGFPKPVNGVIVRSPRSHLFKVWARRAGFALLVVEWRQPGRGHRVVVSVPPAYRGALKGLGAALEQAETARRAEQGKARGGKPRWPDVDNDDPWYDGRAPVHAYTIVDAPRLGTVLDLAEVVGIVREGKWVADEVREGGAERT